MNRQSPRPADNSGQDAAEISPSRTATAAIQPDIAGLLTAGLTHHQAGRLADAEIHYRRILAAVPDHADVLHLLGGVAYQTGRHEAAIELIGRAIERNGNDPSYHCSRGLALQSLDRLDEAVASYDRALLLNPDYAIALINRGNALQALELFTEALESYDRALATEPDFAAVWLNRGNALQGLGRWPEALESFDRALVLRPDYAEISISRGITLQQLGRLAEALESYDRALALKPKFAEALINRGNILQQLGRFAEALESYDQALSMKLDFVEAWLNRGNTLQRLDRFAEALESYDRALALKPDYSEALLNRGNTLQQLGDLAEALESYDRALAFKPDFASALVNRGNALQQLGRFAEALESYDRALAVAPHFSEAFLNRGNALQQLATPAEAPEGSDPVLALVPDDAAAWRNRGVALRFQGEPDEAIASFRATDLDGGYAMGQWFNTRQRIWDWGNFRDDETKARDALKTSASRLAPFALLALSSTPQEQLDLARQITAAVELRASPMLPRAKPRPAEKIRLGYLSHDFRENAVAILISGLIEQHDRRRFEVVGYSYGPDDRSAYRARLERAFDRFVDIRDMQDREAAELIHSDAVDILIDLNGYTGDSRAEIVAYRPAPIQVNYLGFTATMGADFIDYIIVDRFVVPMEQQAFFSERLVHLPDCYQCNDDKREIAERTPSRAECGLTETGFVFCCFSNSYKITPAFFDIWMRLLAAVPGSVLWLLEPWTQSGNALAKANLAREAAARGVMPERLIFAPRLPFYPDHLARHHPADLFLDTLPFNAHTTASDALWAGLPVLTCAGNSFVGRVAGSMLHALGLGELVMASVEEYEAMALRLARDCELLTGLRERLAQNRLTYPLFDTKRSARNVEAAYSRMWETWIAGHPPTAFSIP